MNTRMKRWALVGTGLGLAASISAAALFFELPMSAPATAADAQAAPQAVPVTVAVAKSHDVTTWEEFSGRLEAIDRVQIRSRVAGAIQSVDFREGALVKAGDLLFTIDPAPYEAAVSQAQGQVASAEAKMGLARTELERGRRLSENRTISQSELDTRQNALAEAEANLRTAEAGLKSAELELGYTKVKAPVAGRVGRIEITVGNLVAAGSAAPALTTLVSIDPIYASFSASEELVSQALAQLPSASGELPALGEIPVEIGTLADEGTPLKGKLQLIDNQVDAASGTIGVRAVFDNPEGRLIPGQFVRIRMGQPKPVNHMLVSDRAIGTDQDKKFVYVVDKDNKVSYRPVTLGASVDGGRIIEDGLSDGETIVVNGLQRIRPGVVVQPQMEDSVAAVN
ncbi:efflux RND transporter periplasmic adaptor subunit [Rhizobium halophytocola]|uniref:Multidrug efflux system membrane fusion protein n=1 Tax=Rhizobium halophytocola TaxID=735519 RepID=A0ABS4DV20_9HYPH|nr:efflux RND transporter periplasmic adaptor subunit [Rhizobium halophytocola]MBP1849534.1 multidrug efflux system membrane fusion protein [Rhizobium halophytocola]